LRVRRARFVAFFCEDQPFVDIERLLQGVAESRSVQQLYALPALTGAPAPLTRDELDLVLTLPAGAWSELDDPRLPRLAYAGVVVADGASDERLAELRAREEALLAAQWDLHGALFHFLTRWRDVDLRRLAAGGGSPLAELPAPTKASLEAFVELFGPAPPAFADAGGGTAVELPLVERSNGVFGALRARQTTRSWDARTPLSVDDLSLILRYVFGAHGYVEGPHDIVILRRTSPSGGALHAVDPYLLVTNVHGLEAGLYGYDGRRHCIACREPLERAQAIELGTLFTCGQDYFGAAHVLFLLAARFERTFWKYRRHPKAYPVALMDAAHLSQTLYLVATELGLGAFATVAVNAAAIDERLGLDGVRAGVLAVLGCGRPGEPSEFDPDFRPYVPRRTQLHDSDS
jgi:putative peptide maturation dehydrogenase